MDCVRLIRGGILGCFKIGCAQSGILISTYLGVSRAVVSEAELPEGREVARVNEFFSSGIQDEEEPSETSKLEATGT